jgi:hypothetical protein
MLAQELEQLLFPLGNLGAETIIKYTFWRVDAQSFAFSAEPNVQFFEM